ncbi:4Fe-4S dicluster domain-containing protein, partial [bacterium]|nr:4Fe-4S dicluster domain-containing protein [bacterium]
MSNPLFRWISRFWSPPKGEQIDLSRRTAITTGLAGFFGALFVKIMPDSGQKTYNPALVRPPGSVAEEEFLGKCVRCGECMKVCPTNCIQPAQLQAGMEGQWTPVMDYTIGNCEYECSLCGQVCPTGAIVPLTLAEKKKVKIGTAFFDTNRCLPYAFQRMCIV